MIPTHAFCIAGKHSVNLVDAKGWRLVPAKMIGDKWIYDVTSRAKIYCCPAHMVENEPSVPESTEPNPSIE